MGCRRPHASSVSSCATECVEAALQERWIPRHPTGLSRRLGSNCDPKIDEPVVQQSINFWIKSQSTFGLENSQLLDKKSIDFWAKSQSTFGPQVNHLLGQKSINVWGQKSINFCATQSTLSEKSITPVIISAPRENQVPAKGSKACRNTDNFVFRHTKCNFLSHIKLLRMPWVAVAL